MYSLNKKEIINHETLCRLCGNNAMEYVDIFNDDGLKRNLSLKTMSCLHIQVSMSDVLPTIICTSCCNILDNFYKFLENANEAQDYLQKIYDSSRYIAVNEEDKHENCVENNTSDILSDIEHEEDKQLSSKNKLVLNNLSNRAKISKVLQDYPWTCTLCDYKDTKSVNNLHDHFKVSHNNIPPIYKCIHCDRSYNIYRSFTKHLSLHENPQIFECDICGKTFNVKSTLVTHAIVHTKHKSHLCTICEKTFKSAAILSVHKKRHLPDEIRQKFICHICNKTFSTKSTLDNHEKLHTGTRNFMCEYCGKAFIEKGSLVYHLLCHSIEKNYHCSTCGSQFRTEQHMKKHLAVHSSKAHRCNICDRTFRARSTLTSHQRIHTGEMPYSCEHCGKKFRFGGILTNHRRIHTGEKPYTCSYCERTFANRANLNKHIRRVHNNYNKATDNINEILPKN